MKLGVICQSCGIEAPSKQVEFYQNIGALVIRYHKKIRGRLCKKCVHKHFWRTTLTTAAIGWLGTISIVVAPIFVLNNIFRYVFALGMPAVPKDARVPVATAEVLARFMPQAKIAFDRVNAGEDLSDVARSISPSVGVTPGEVIKSMEAIVKQQRMNAQNNQPTGGFPVIMKEPPLAMVQQPQPAPPLTTLSPAPVEKAPTSEPPPQIGIGL